MGGPFTEKGSCRHLVFKCSLAKEEMCDGCSRHDRFEDRYLRKLCEEGKEQRDGVCQRLHSSGREQRATARAAQDNTCRPTKRSRSAPPLPRSTETTESPIKKKTAGKRRKKGRKTLDHVGFRNTVEAYAAGKEVKDKNGVEKGIIRALAGNNCTLNPVGRSKSTVSKMRATAGGILNSVANLAGAAGETNADEYRDLIVANAYKQKENLSAIDPNNQRQESNATSAVAKDIARKEETDKRAAVMMRCLGKYSDIVKNEMKSPAERRKFIALFAATDGMTRPAAEEAIGIKILPNEWEKARLHARWPGALKEAPRTKIFRQRVSSQYIQRIMNFMESPGNLQRYAYGSKLLNIAAGSSGSHTIEIDRVDRLKKVEQLTVEYIMDLEAEFNGVGDDTDLPNERCTCREKNSLRRCRLQVGHTEKHKYTAKSSLSMTTVRNIVKTLTGDDIKRLAGLDDIKVLKGRDNFKRMEQLVSELCDDVDKEKQLISQIKDAEIFYMNDFQNHLMEKGNQHCSCLTCGFCEDDHAADTEGGEYPIDGIKCDSKEFHMNSCEQCSSSYAIVGDELKGLHASKKAQLEARVASDFELQQHENKGAAIDSIGKDLTEYRGHLARHKSEADHDEDAINSLANDTAIVISDFKMKILSCFFRENQLKFFGKRGTSCLGFMIISNPEDAEARQNGVKEVKFVMMFTDDSLQDEVAIASAKTEIYCNHLPEGIEKVHFHSDGAGAFKSVYHLAIQPMWYIWTGIEESVKRVTPAGGGKSALDGMFGRMNTCLQSAVDQGMSYYDAKTTCEALESSGGLAATTVLYFRPQRASRLYITMETSIQSVLRSELNPDGSLTLYKHSGFGTGITIFPSDFAYSLKCKPSKAMMSKDKDLLFPRKKAILPPKDLVKKIFMYVGRKREDRLHIPAVRAFFESKHFKAFIIPNLEDFPPSCSAIEEHNNRKKDVRSIKTAPGEGANHPIQRQASRQRRGVARAQRDQKTTEEVRLAKTNAGIFLCPSRCPNFFHYCRCEYLTKAGLENHIQKEKKHDFPQGVSTGDRAVHLASKPGGLLATGSRTNRKDKGFKAFPPVTNLTKGEKDARCYGRFNRIENREIIHKTIRQIEFLDNCFYDNEPKLTPAQTVEIMQKTMDPDGSGLLFCWRKRGTYMPKTGVHKAAYEAWQGCPECGKKPCECNGDVLPENTISSYYAKLSKQLRSRGRLTAKQAETEATQEALVAELEETQQEA